MPTRKSASFSVLEVKLRIYLPQKLGQEVVTHLGFFKLQFRSRTSGTWRIQLHAQWLYYFWHCGKWWHLVKWFKLNRSTEYQLLSAIIQTINPYLQIKDEDLPSKRMKECCNNQQLCYFRCNSSKNMCDIEFQQCLHQQCINITKDKPDKAKHLTGQFKSHLTIWFDLTWIWRDFLSSLWYSHQVAPDGHSLLWLQGLQRRPKGRLCLSGSAYQWAVIESLDNHGNCRKKGK